MNTEDAFRQDGVADDMDPRITIALLRERTLVMGREIRELREAQRRELDEVRRGQEKLSEQMQTVLTALSEARGGWRMMVTLGAFAAAIGAAFAWVVQMYLSARGAA